VTIETGNNNKDDVEDDVDDASSIFGGWSDDEFQRFIFDALMDEASAPLLERYRHVFEKASHCIARWRQRYRGNPQLWKRIFKKERVVKEVIEAIPILDAVDHWMQDQQQDQKVTIVDLCSGKGYLSMMLSEYLPKPSQVDKIILVDKAWARCHAEPSAHHMNWDHIYGNRTDGSSYFATWPIPLHTSKQNLKKSSTLRQMKKRLSSQGGGEGEGGGEDSSTILVLAVHLCGTLSIQAVKLMHQIPEIKALLLKPCCLPGIAHRREKDAFEIGRYSFPTKEVCATGEWRRKEWKGPPRWHLENRFDKWCFHLHQGMKAMDGVDSKLFQIPVQHKGGYQNSFLLAERLPTTPTMWASISSLEAPDQVEKV
jgi:hypothetical protein